MMRIRSVALLAALSVSSAAIAAGTDRQPPERAPSSMTPTEIAQFNQGLESNHPYYIKCRKTDVIGSLAKKLRVCRTNEQWRVASDRGNDNARETLEGFARSGGTNNN